MDQSGNSNMLPMGRTSHPPKSNTVGQSVTNALPPPPIQQLPISKSTAPSSSYQPGTKFHSSHLSGPTIQNVTNTTTSASASSQINDTQYIGHHGSKNSPSTTAPSVPSSSTQEDCTSIDNTIQYPRHRIHRRTKEQETVGLTKSTNNNNNNNTNTNNNSQINQLRDNQLSSSIVNTTSQQYSRSIVQFDLEASAFPPLPGLDADNKIHNSPSDTTMTIDSLQSQNRLSDVVKGTAKLKCAKDKDVQQSNQHNQQQLMINSRSTSPGTSANTTVDFTGGHSAIAMCTTATTGGGGGGGGVATTSTNQSDTTDNAHSTTTLTPPSSPAK